LPALPARAAPFQTRFAIKFRLCFPSFISACRLCGVLRARLQRQIEALAQELAEQERGE
jgi:hypothetical protein